MRDIHRRTWHLVQKAVTDYSCSGLIATTGLVEGMLLLADHVPGPDEPPDEASVRLLGMRGLGDVPRLHGTETRRFWAYTGTAIRAAYGLGLTRRSFQIHAGRGPLRVRLPPR
jgi:hypothetical protein